ncbi:MAG: isocitrate/isopropylmalate family dehydrogenase [Pseudomonadota bacterium]
MAQTFRIALLPGDGVGPEVMAPTRALLNRIAASSGAFEFAWQTRPAGAAHFQATGEALPASTLDAARAADAILLAAMGDPAVRYPDGREITPQITLRMELGLYAGVRPVRPIPGARPVLADPRAAAMDFVILRESTEGLFAPSAPGTRSGDDEARETMVITRRTSAQLFDFAFRLAGRRAGQRRRQGRVTSVDKANVFQAFAFWREVFWQRAEGFPEVSADTAYVDAFAMRMVNRPWEIDVAVTENMFGDILSDLGAALMGGLGFAPSADIGRDHAVFQPCHGSAPDIAGQGIANPTAMILSAAMMLEWLAERHDVPAAEEAGGRLRRAVDAAFAAGDVVPPELGGTDRTEAVAAAVATAFDRLG